MSKKASKTTSRLQQSAVHIPRSRAGLFARSNSPHALKRLWPAALILAIGLSAAFANSFGAGLVVDSAIIVGHDPRLADANWENVHLILTKNYWWPTFGSDLYRPVTTLTYLFNYSVLGNGNNVLGYHIINLLLHWINAVLVFLLARRLLGQFWLALFVAAIFSLHPLTVECVTNIVGRADLLSTLLILAGLLCHILQYEVGGWRRAWCLIGLGLAAVMGVFCKESAAVLPALMLLYDLSFAPSRQDGSYRWQSWLRRTWISYALVISALVMLALARHFVLKDTPVFSQVGGDNPIVMAGFWTGRMTAIKVIGYYLMLLIWPARLSCDYSFNQITLMGWTFGGQDLHAWLALAVVIGLIVTAAAAYRRDRSLFFFMALGAISFLPMSNLPMAIGTIMGERFMYLPLVGFAGSLAIGLPLLTRRLLQHRLKFSPRVCAVFLCASGTLATVALGVRTFERNYDWQDARSLWASAVEVCPNSYKVYKNLALSMADRKPGGGDIDSVIAVAERGLAILDSHPLPLLHSPHMFFSELGRYYGIKAEQLNESSASSGASDRTIREWYDRSLSAFRRAVEIDQAVNEASRQFDLRRGRRPEEIIDVGSPTIYRDMGVLYLSRKEPEQALTAFQYWRRLSPDSHEAAHLCGLAAALAGHLDDAAVYLLESIILNGEYQKGWEDLNKFYTELKVLPPNPPSKWAVLFESL